MMLRKAAIFAIPILLGTVVAATRRSAPEPVVVREVVPASKSFEPPQVSLEAVSLERKPEKARKKRRRKSPNKAVAVTKPETSASRADSAAPSPQPPIASAG